ncbi:MAG: LysR family transcriptional regulator [Firmicutes bacterium]|nr:LysR family transcriptional regulator [Bacillota bacterium]
MIEFYILKQFITFIQTKTLSETAEKLNLSQPAISRNMKKLEDDIGVKLFDRQKNKIEPNENGKMLYELAEKLIFDAEDIVKRMRAFDRLNHTISVGFCAPAPIWKLTPLLTRVYTNMNISTEIKNEEELLNALSKNKYQLIVLPHESNESEHYSVPFESERLYLSMPRNHKFFDRESICFEDIDGENILLFSEIGFWHDIHLRKMPNSRFITQNDRYNFTELVNASSLLSFSSDLVKKYTDMQTDRKDIPITDEEAQVTYYLVCQKNNKKKYNDLFRSLN